MIQAEKNPGKTDWYFPDTYLPDTSDNTSHEAICVLNTGEHKAQIQLKLFFETQEPMEGFYVVCEAQRTIHIRLDKLSNSSGLSIPQCQAYSVWLHSDQPVLCQYTRVDANLPLHALMTTMGV